MLYAIILAFAFAAFAAPVEEKRQVSICNGGDPVCCATDVLSVADLDCEILSITPADSNDFIDICKNQGRQAKCCLLPFLDQAIICGDVKPTAQAPPRML